MDSFFSHNKPAANSDDHNSSTTTHTEKHKPSPTELLSSAKLVADAARASLNHDTNNVDRAKVADAAADLLDAAQGYGKMDENSGLGKYVEKAETYLHSYNPSNSSTTHTTVTASHSNPHSDPQTTTISSHSTTTHSNPDAEGGKHGGGYGDYLKMAEGIIKKH